MTRKHNWGEDRAFYYNQAGALRSFLSNVTDLVAMDAFGQASAGQSAFRTDDLLALRRLLDRHLQRGETLKEV